MEAASDGTGRYGAGGGCYPLLTLWTPRPPVVPGCRFCARTLPTLYGVSHFYHPHLFQSFSGRSFVPIALPSAVRPHHCPNRRAGRRAAPGTENHPGGPARWGYAARLLFPLRGVCLHSRQVRLAYPEGSTELETDAGGSPAVHHMPPWKACTLIPRRRLPFQATMTCVGWYVAFYVPLASVARMQVVPEFKARVPAVVE